MITSTVQFFKDAQQHVELFDDFVSKHDLVGKIKADHICYKCGSSSTFENIRALLEHESEYLYQSIISDRRIAYIRFKNGLETSLGSILFLELSDQKPDLSQKDGFDHIEAYPTTCTYEELIRDLQQTETVVTVERPHHTTDDVVIGSGFLFRATRGPLIEKIKDSEMV